MAAKSLIRLAVFGNPVTHSLSPRIHGLFADQCGLDIDYRAIEATPESFPGRVRELAGAGGRGCNITVPLKHDAWKLAGRCSESAARARAANTLVFHDEWEPQATRRPRLGESSEASGTRGVERQWHAVERSRLPAQPGAGKRDSFDWFADNTDGMGLVGDLQSIPGCRLQGARLCLIGAGGAAASVLGALLQANPEEVLIVNRTKERAAELAHAHSGLGKIGTCTPAELSSGASFDLLVNATSLGHDGEVPRLSPSWLTPDGLCYDMNYGKAAEPLRQWCLGNGVRYSDGLGMLVGQAALSFRLWTNQAPCTAEVLRELRAAPGTPSR